MNKHPKTSHLPKQKPSWNNLPTKAARVPEKFLPEVLEYARIRDCSGSGFEAIINLLNTLTQEELQQIRVTINSLIPDEQKPAYTANAVSAPNNNVPEIQLSDTEKAAYTASFGFVPSKFQLAIINWIVKGKGNACCNAVAGAGKSSTLLLVAKTLEQQGVDPSLVKVCVFGRENSKDLIKKFGKGWQSSISTLHSAGWALVKQELKIKNSYSVKVSSKKYKDIAVSFGLIPGRGSKSKLLTSQKIVKESNIFFKLLDLVRLCDLIPTAENLEKLCSHHNLEGLLDSKEAAYYLNRCLETGEQQAANKICFDFTDQLWLPSKWELNNRSWLETYDFVLVDECQDLNAAQLELVCMLAGKNGRILAVGDPKQAIMGFAGADNNSYQAIATRINALELPLSICYRCPTQHINLVKKIFPETLIEPSPTAKPGSIEQIEKKQVVGCVQDGDMILSRKTAPLVSLCLKLIANKKNAQIKGRAIGDSLNNEMKLIENYFYFDWNNFNSSLDSYFEDTVATYKGSDNEEQLRENLKDKIDAIREIYKATPHAKSFKDLETEVENIFSDEHAPIILSTCHRAKGLEADRIFIHEPQHMPMEWKRQKPWQHEQEMNLLYVALTRSKSELFIVGDCEWYKPKRDCTQQIDDKEASK